MQISDRPDKVFLAFAANGGRNTIPVASQVGITAGAASFSDGFPPLTRVELAAGGVPPSGLDMNGILFDVSALARWASAGGGYPFDSNFATAATVGGYPKGARVLRSDGTGYWFNSADNNQTDPESSGAVAAGWLPDFTTGAAAVTMTNSNLTLTSSQYGKPVIVISGALTGNLNLIFPNIVGNWSVINATTGAFTITAKTAAGSGVTLLQGAVWPIVGDATNIYSPLNVAQVNAKFFGITGDGSDEWSKLQAYVNWAFTLPSSVNTINGGAGHGMYLIDLCNLTVTVGQPITAPSAGGGFLRIGNGAVKASSSFSGAYVVDFSAASALGYQGIKFEESLIIDANQKGGCLNINHAYDIICDSWLLHFTTAGINQGSGCNSLSGSPHAFQFIYGEVGFDTNARTGVAFSLNGPDNKFIKPIVGYSRLGFYVNAGYCTLMAPHVYGCLEGSLYQTVLGGRLDITDPYFDVPGFITLCDPYETSIKGGSINWLPSYSPLGSLINLKASGTAYQIFGLNISGVKFIANTYPVAGTITLSAVTKGASKTCTSSTGYFTANMVGATIRETGTGGTGYSRITAVSGGNATCVNMTTWSTTTPGSNWTLQPSAIATDETSVAYTPTIKNSVISGNSFYSCQPCYTEVSVSRAVSASVSGEIEMGHLMPIWNVTSDCWLSPLNGGATNFMCKVLYTSSGVAAYQFDSAFTGDLKVLRNCNTMSETGQ